MGGVGLDHYQGDARLALPAGPTESVAVEGQISSQRRVVFVSGCFNFLVSRFSAELGVAEGVESPFTARQATFDPAGRTWYASVALRLTV